LQSGATLGANPGHEHALADEAQSHNSGTFAGLNPAQTITLYQPLLHRIALSMVRCRQDAEDIVQETFLKWLDAKQNDIQNTKAYLVKAVTNNCLNHLKTFRKRKVDYFESLDLTRFFNSIKLEINFGHLDWETEFNAAVRILHSKLEPLERAVFVLKEVFDFDYDQIQAAFDRRKDQCRQLVCRAKKKLEVPGPGDKGHQPSPSGLLETLRHYFEDHNPAGLVHALKRDVPHLPK
jgi:RNA polymerase sigma-70 factor (ECF subfamily)